MHEETISFSFLLLILVSLGAGVYYLWQDPNVKAVFREQTIIAEDPLVFLKDKQIQIRNTRGEAAANRALALEESVQEVPKVVSTIPDTQLAKLVLQRLYTIRKHSGISVSVRKSIVYLFGSAQSEEDRNSIVEMVKQLPGVYRVDASKLKTAPP